MTVQRITGEIDWAGVPWVWPEELEGVNAYAWFARELDITGQVDEAWLAVAADTSYRLWVNGQFVLAGPERETWPYFYYDAVDVRDLLRPGRNRLRILAHYQGEASNSYQPGPGGLLVQGKVRCNGVEFSLSGDQWLAREARGYHRSAPRLGNTIGFAEHCQVEASEADMLLDSIDGSPPRIVGRHPYPPYLRPVPAEMALRKLEKIAANSMERRPGGMLIDFGREVFGFVELTVRADNPAEFSLAYAEQLTDGEVNHRKASLDYRDVLSVAAGRHTWKSYEKRAFRYAWLDDADVHVIEMAVQEYGYPYDRDAEQRALARTADELDRRIVEVSARTIRLCSEDLLVDCPWRERAQYLDPYAYFGAMKAIFGTLEPVRKYLRQLARGAGQRGMLPMCYPSPPDTTIIPDFVMVYALALRKYAELSGDMSTIAECYGAAESSVERIAAHADAEGLLANVPGWVFLDNTFELCRAPRSAGLNALYAGAAEALAHLSDRLGQAEKAQYWRNRLATVRESFRRVFLRPGRLLDSDRSEDFDQRHFWNYHHGFGNEEKHDSSFVLKAKVRLQAGQTQLYVSFFNGCRMWLDGRLIFEAKAGGDWENPPLFSPASVVIDARGGEHELMLEVQNAWMDWEVFLGCDEKLTFADVSVAEAAQFGEFAPGRASEAAWRTTELRPYKVPRMSQLSVGLAALYDMLDPKEANTLLKAAMPAVHYTNLRRRTTPFFVSVTDAPSILANNILPCNTPWAMQFFCQALRKHGLLDQARSLLRQVYGQELALGATSWWEEWGDRSSLCHGWGAFVAEYLLPAD